METVPCQVVGAGPAGIGLVLALCNRIAAGNGNATTEQRILDSLQLFEAAEKPGGRMERYRVNANTSAHDVVKGIFDGTPFVKIRDQYLKHPQTQSELIHLSRIGELMVQPLVKNLSDFLGDRLHCGTEVARIEFSDAGFASYDHQDRLQALSKNLLLACGAREEPLPELKSRHSRWEGSGQFLLRDNLDGLPDAKGDIAIIGASHSAFSCAWRLLNDPLFADYARHRDIVILQRRERIKLRCTPEFAAEYNIEYDPNQDIDPSSGIVFHNGGLRKDAKMLYLKIRDGQEPRVKMVKIQSLDERQDLLAGAALILQAAGFHSNFPRIEKNGQSLAIGNPTQEGELRDLDSNWVIHGMSGMGLGLNILPAGVARGESSFDGSIHGFQTYPLAIAPLIIDHLVANLSETIH